MNRTLYLTGPETVELRHEPVPQPRRGELVLRVEAATTCGTDLKVFFRGGHPTMLRPPCPFGHEMSGVVAATGAGVEGWRDGDAAVVANSASCGVCPRCVGGRENLCQDLRYLNGAFADSVLVPARFVQRSTYRRPAGLDPAVAALAEPLACVLHGVENAGVADLEEVAVLGAGPIGLMFIAELARRGHRVVAADPAPARRRWALELGAAVAVEVVGDPGDGARVRSATASGHGTAAVIEATGTSAGWAAALDAVGVGGTAILFGGCAPGTTVACDTHRIHYSELTVKGVYHHRPATFRAALERLAEPGCVIGRLLELETDLDGVEDALRKMASREILKAAVRP